MDPLWNTATGATTAAQHSAVADTYIATHTAHTTQQQQLSDTTPSVSHYVQQNTNILNIPQSLNRQFSTDMLQLSPYTANLNAVLTSPQLTSIPHLGLSQQYLQQLQSPQTRQHSASSLVSPLTQPPSYSSALMSSVQHTATLQPTNSTQPAVHNTQHTSSSTVVPLRMRTHVRPVIKLTAELMTTYNSINDTYYRHKAQRPHRHSADTQYTSTNANDGIKRTGVHNNACDDKDYNYIVVPNERIGLNQRYIVEGSIGKGSFGRVVKCFDRITQQWVAVKIIKSKSAFYRQAQVEINILKHLAADAETADKYNIVYMYDTFVHCNHQCIVFELLSLNLYELLRNTRFNGVSLKLVAKFAHQLLQTLWYLNSNVHAGGKSVLHCDLKPENILLRNLNKSSIKVIDFGMYCQR